MIHIRDLIKAFYNYSSPLILVIDDLHNPVGVLKKQRLIMEAAHGNIKSDDIKKIIGEYMENIEYEEVLRLLETKNNSLPCVDINGNEIGLFTMEPREQEEHIPFGIAIQSLPIGVIMCSNLNNIVYINKKAQQIIGKKENEVLGRDIQNVMRDSRVTEAFKVSATVFEIRIGTEATPFVCISKVIKRSEKKLGTILILIELNMIKRIYNEIPDDIK